MGETRPADRWPFSPIMMLAFTVNNVAAHPHLQNLKSVVVGLERGADTVLLRRADTAPAVPLPSGPASFATESSDSVAPASSAETASAEESVNPPTVELSNPPPVDLSTLVAYHPVATMLETSLHSLLAMPRLRSLGTSGLPVDFALDAVGRRGSRLRHLTLKVDLLEEGEFASATAEKGHHEAEPQSSGEEKHGTAPEVVAATSASSFVEPLPRATDPLPHAWRWLARVRDWVATRQHPDDSGKAPHRLRSVTMEVLTQPPPNIYASPPDPAVVPRLAIERTLREMHALGTRGIIKVVDGSGWEFDTKYPEGR
ncbi:hypothetical protein EV714DRAFT_203218 [Schizophyllum commune]